MDDAPYQGKNRTQVQISTSRVTDYFISHAILLCGEGESGKRGLHELLRRGCWDIESNWAYKQLHILQAERRSIGAIRGVFTWAQKEEEG
jgi:hypothetical protein